VVIGIADVFVPMGTSRAIIGSISANTARLAARSSMMLSMTMSQSRKSDIELASTYREVQSNVAGAAA
jgi:hypothetical protein